MGWTTREATRINPQFEKALKNLRLVENDGPGIFADDQRHCVAVRVYGSGYERIADLGFLSIQKILLQGSQMCGPHDSID
ncbi:MAG: hypothetical protein R3C26_06000 [Calditrichia bacterium]